MEKECNYHSFVMGCDFDMTFIADSVKQSDEYFAKSLVIAQEFEKCFSRFDQRSELSRLNQQKKMEVSQEFLEVWFMAYNLYQETKGIFNPLVQVSEIGYDRTFENIGRGDRVEGNLEYNIDMDKIEVVGNKIILQKEQVLDFGGFLKGHVAQIIVQSFSNVSGVVVNIGGDIYVGGNVFEMEIINPIKDGKNVKVVLENEALCTSGVYKRKWKTDGQSKHHILDVKTKNSAMKEIISASVIDINGGRADAYATMAVAMGVSKTKMFFEKNNIVGVLICADGVIITTGNIKMLT